MGRWEVVSNDRMGSGGHCEALEVSGMTRGTERLLVDALIHGPGLETNPAIEP